MKKKEFRPRLKEIRSSISDDPVKAAEDLDALSKETIPIEDASYFLRHLSFTRALVAYAEADYDMCITEATNYIQLETEATEDIGFAYLLRGKSHFYQEAPENCLSDLAAADTPDLTRDLRVDLYKHRGKALLMLQRFDAAIATFQEAKAIAPEDTENLSSLANAFMQSENYSAAVEELTEAARLQPDCTEILFALGNAHFKCSEYKSAEAVFTTAITLKPNDALFYRHRAITRKQLGKKNAAEDWMIFQLLNPETP